MQDEQEIKTAEVPTSTEAEKDPETPRVDGEAAPDTDTTGPIVPGGEDDLDKADDDSDEEEDEDVEEV